MALFGNFLSLLKESYPPEATKKEKDHGPPKATFTNIARHCEASAHTACGNSSPTVEHQASSTAHVAADVSRRPPLPCFGRIQDAALAHKRGSLETLGFKWHSLGTFCCYWQKVIRRRQQKREGSWTAEGYLHKYSPPLRSQCSHCLWQSVPHGRASGFFNHPIQRQRE